MKRILPLLLAILLFFNSRTGFAQDAGEEVVIDEAPPIVLTPEIESPEAIEIGKKVILDASASQYDPEEKLQFFWDLGDGNTTREGPEIVHTYSSTGEFTITLTLKQAEKEATVQQTIFVFDSQAILFSTTSLAAANSEIVEQAKSNGVFLKMITVSEETSTVIMEENLLQQMQEERESIAGANTLIFWTPSSLGVQSFTRFWQNLEPDRQFPLNNKLMVRITEGSMPVSSATLQQTFEILKPPFFLLTRPEAIHPIFHEKNFEQIQTTLKNRGIEFKIIDASSGPSAWLLLTKMITEFLAQGIPASTIFLILSFPFIAFLVAFSRQVIGLSTYGVFLPIMLALSFQILTLPFALFVLVVIILFSFFLRSLFNRLDILYIPRASLMLSAIALSLLSVIWFALHFGSPVSITLAIFPMLVMSTLSEKFLSAQSEEGFRTALTGGLETILVAIIAFFLVGIPFFKELLLSLPELIVFPLLGIFLLGKFTGLRISEYFRFRTLLREGMEE